MISYVPITIAKEKYKPELTTMNEENTFKLHHERVKDDRIIGSRDVLCDYLIEEFDRRLIEDIWRYK